MKAKIIFTNYHPMFTNCQAEIYQSINFLRGSIKIKSGDLSGILTGSAFIFLVASICTLFKVSDVDRASKRSVLFFRKVPNTKNTNIQKITFSFFSSGKRGQLSTKHGQVENVDKGVYFYPGRVLVCLVFFWQAFDSSVTL